MVSLSNQPSAGEPFDKLRANGSPGSNTSILRKLIAQVLEEPVEPPSSASPGVEGIVDGVAKQVKREQQHCQSPGGEYQQMGSGPQYGDTAILKHHQPQTGRRGLDTDPQEAE